MILPYSKFKEFCFYKDNTNYLDFILCQLSIKHSKNVFNSFVENKTFDNWFKLMESNVSSDTKRILLYAAYNNISYDSINTVSKLYDNKWRLFCDFSSAQCISDYEFCYYKLINQKMKNDKSTNSTIQQIKLNR